MNAKITPIDSTTDLLALDDGTFGIRWAGCFYGPAVSIAEVAKDELLAQCQAKIDDAGTVWQYGRLFNPDDGLGERFIETANT